MGTPLDAAINNLAKLISDCDIIKIPPTTVEDMQVENRKLYDNNKALVAVIAAVVSKHGQIIQTPDGIEVKELRYSQVTLRQLGHPVSPTPDIIFMENTLELEGLIWLSIFEN